MNHMKTVRFEGGPLGGRVIRVAAHMKTVKAINAEGTKFVVYTLAQVVGGDVDEIGKLL